MSLSEPERPDLDELELEPFHIDVVAEGDAVRIAPVGELDLASVDEVREEVERQRGAGVARVILDLRGVLFLDSTGLRLVLELDSQAGAEGWEFSLIPGSQAVQRIFEVTRVTDRLRFVER